jgi:hypothetical protein
MFGNNSQADFALRRRRRQQQRQPTPGGSIPGLRQPLKDDIGDQLPAVLCDMSTAHAHLLRHTCIPEGSNGRRPPPPATPRAPATQKAREFRLCRPRGSNAKRNNDDMTRDIARVSGASPSSSLPLRRILEEEKLICGSWISGPAPGCLAGADLMNRWSLLIYNPSRGGAEAGGIEEEGDSGFSIGASP